jgi:hypothetical protein
VPRTAAEVEVTDAAGSVATTGGTFGIARPIHPIPGSANQSEALLLVRAGLLPPDVLVYDKYLVDFLIGMAAERFSTEIAVHRQHSDNDSCGDITTKVPVEDRGGPPWPQSGESTVTFIATPPKLNCESPPTTPSPSLLG